MLSLQIGIAAYRCLPVGRRPQSFERRGPSPRSTAPLPGRFRPTPAPPLAARDKPAHTEPLSGTARWASLPTACRHRRRNLPAPPCRPMLCTRPSPGTMLPGGYGVPASRANAMVPSTMCPDAPASALLLATAPAAPASSRETGTQSARSRAMRRTRARGLAKHPPLRNLCRELPGRPRTDTGLAPRDGLCLARTGPEHEAFTGVNLASAPSAAGACPHIAVAQGVRHAHQLHRTPARAG